jgi:hypothetical protein
VQQQGLAQQVYIQVVWTLVIPKIGRQHHCGRITVWLHGKFWPPYWIETLANLVTALSSSNAIRTRTPATIYSGRAGPLQMLRRFKQRSAVRQRINCFRLYLRGSTSLPFLSVRAQLRAIHQARLPLFLPQHSRPGLKRVRLQMPGNKMIHQQILDHQSTEASLQQR